MTLDSPFVCSHFDENAGNVYLQSVSRELVLVARFWAAGKAKLYEPCPKFIARYENIIDVGTVLRWTSDAELKVWTDRIIYFSFLALAKDNENGFWFLTNIDANSSSESTDMPIAYGHFFQGYNKDIWVLLKDGHRVWPVRTTNGRFYTGWDEFWKDEDLHIGCKVIFGVEKKWIFNVIVYDEHLNQISGGWPLIGEKLPFAASSYSDLQTSCPPSTFLTEECMFQFAYIPEQETLLNQVFADNFLPLLLNHSISDIIFVMGSKEWIVPIINQRFRYVLLKQFVHELGICPGDLVLVKVIRPTFVWVLVLEADGIEKIYNWF